MNDTLTQLLAYEYWANRRVIFALHEADAPPPRALQVMAHVLGAQAEWLRRLNKAPEPMPIWPALSLDDLLPTADRQHQQLRAYLEQQTPSKLTRRISYQNSRGEPFQDRAQDILLHLSHHAAYHRGQVIQLIRPHLAQVPAIDYIVWVRSGNVIS